MKKELPSNDKVWIVKASESILGPFSVEELAKAVRTKHVGLLDEARLSESRHAEKNPSAGRWLFIRDIPELQIAISELSTQEDTIEKTHTAAHTQLSVTRRLDEESTPVPPQVPIVPKATPSAPEMRDIPAQSANARPSSQEPVRSYGVPKKAPFPLGKWVVGVLATGGLAFGLALFAQKQSSESDQKKIWSQFQQYYVAQLYDDAFRKLNEFRQEYPDQPAALTRAGLLFLNPGRELVKAKRLFERSIQLDPQNKELMVQNLNGLGLVSLYEGSLGPARSSFERALTLEPNNLFTKINLISLSMTRGKWDEAWDLSEQIMSVEPKKAYLIQAAIATLSEKHAAKARGVLMDLMRTLDHSSYLRPEMRLMILRLANLTNDTITLESQLKFFFEDLPSLQMKFSENPILDQRWRDWNFLYQFCTEINGPEALGAEMLSIQVVCISQIQKWNEAEKIMTEGLKRFPNHPKLILSQLHMLTSMGRWPEVRALMRLQTLNQDSAASWMFAKTCIEENNMKCADSYLNVLSQKPYVGTPVYDLRARLQCSNKNLESCRYSVSQGLTQDPLATGLLTIRHRLEESL